LSFQKNYFAGQPMNRSIDSNDFLAVDTIVRIEYVRSMLLCNKTVLCFLFI